MKTLVIDRDRLSTQLLEKKLLGAGCDVTIKSVKNDGLDIAATEPFDTIFVDPAPLKTARPIVLALRRSRPREYPFIILMSHAIPLSEALKSGTNDVLHKPLDVLDIEQKIRNTRRLNRYISKMKNFGDDFELHPDVMNKLAFRQLFFSSIDRADRYGERSYLISFKLINRRNKEKLPPTETISGLQNELAGIRRQSDILAHIEQDEYCLFIQRPPYELEPVEAAKRLATTLEGRRDFLHHDGQDAQLSITALEIPTGALVWDYDII